MASLARLDEEESGEINSPLEKWEEAVFCIVVCFWA
jgi:hypothetical protein